MASISSSLWVLEMRKCNVKHTGPLNYLDRLERLILKDNFIEDMDEVASFLRTISGLNYLDLRGNSVTKTHKYRD